MSTRLIGLLLLLAGCGSPAPPEAPPADAAAPTHREERPNLLLVSIDTLRADRLGSYGHSRPTSPRLDALAASGVRFADVITPSTGTLSAHRCILGGRLPHEPDEGPTLAERLLEAGYRTAAFVDGGFMRARFGHDRGFETYVDEFGGQAPQGSRAVADRKGGGFKLILPRAEEWLAAPAAEPFFAFVHTYDVHCPYEPPDEYARMFTGGRPSPLDLAGRCGNKRGFNGMNLDDNQVRWIREHYDAGIRHVDDLLGDFLDRLRSSGTLENTVVMVISDHGESLGEMNLWGHNRLHPAQLFVPWIVAGHGIPSGRVVEAPVSLIDLVPTTLGLLGLPVPDNLTGIDLSPAMNGTAELDPHRLRVCEVRQARALLRDAWMVIRPLKGDSHRLHRLESGTLYGPDVAATEPSVAAGLLAAWETLAARTGQRSVAADEPEIDDRIRRELRTLGYVE